MIFIPSEKNFGKFCKFLFCKYCLDVKEMFCKFVKHKNFKLSCLFFCVIFLLAGWGFILVGYY